MQGMAPMSDEVLKACQMILILTLDNGKFVSTDENE